MTRDLRISGTSRTDANSGAFELEVLAPVEFVVFETLAALLDDMTALYKKKLQKVTSNHEIIISCVNLTLLYIKMILKTQLLSTAII